MIVDELEGEKATDHGAAVPSRCARCRNHTTLHYVTATNWFRVWSIPLFPFPTKHFLCCSECGRGTRLDRVQAQHALAMVWTTKSFWEQRLSPQEYANAVEDFYAATALRSDLVAVRRV